MSRMDVCIHDLRNESYCLLVMQRICDTFGIKLSLQISAESPETFLIKLCGAIEYETGKTCFYTTFVDKHNPFGEKVTVVFDERIVDFVQEKYRVIFQSMKEAAIPKNKIPRGSKDLWFKVRKYE